MVNVLVFEIIVSQFEISSRYYVNFQTYTHGKGMNFLTPRDLGSLMAQEIWVQSQVELYQRLKKWYFILPCLTLSIIR